MRWTDRYPHPGDPPEHPGPEPLPETTPAGVSYAARLINWWSHQADWNAFVRRERLHRIARAVDQLLYREGTPSARIGLPPPGLQPHEEIALVTGVMFLDGSTVLSR